MRTMKERLKPWMSKTRLFIGGIMQGSSREMAMCSQDYRTEIAGIIRQCHPDIEIVDPFQLHPDSVTYERKQAVETFLAMLDRAAQADILVAYLPQASLGTAVEIWQACRAGKPTIVISPMSNNWMLWATATHLVPDIPAFAQFIAEGRLIPYLRPVE